MKMFWSCSVVVTPDETSVDIFLNSSQTKPTISAAHRLLCTDNARLHLSACVCMCLFRGLTGAKPFYLAVNQSSLNSSVSEAALASFRCDITVNFSPTVTPTWHSRRTDAQMVDKMTHGWTSAHTDSVVAIAMGDFNLCCFSFPCDRKKHAAFCSDSCWPVLKKVFLSGNQ